MKPSAIMRRPLVLVADEDDETRLMLRTLLKHHGFEIVECRDGRAAVSVATRLEPDVILMDARLLEWDGCAVTEQLRQDGSPTRRVPIVFVSSDATGLTESRARAAGCTCFLRKPVDFDELVRTLVALAAPARASLEH